MSHCGRWLHVSKAMNWFSGIVQRTFPHYTSSGRILLAAPSRLTGLQLPPKAIHVALTPLSMRPCECAECTATECTIALSLKLYYRSASACFCNRPMYRSILAGLPCMTTFPSCMYAAPSAKGNSSSLCVTQSAVTPDCVLTTFLTASSTPTCRTRVVLQKLEERQSDDSTSADKRQRFKDAPSTLLEASAQAF